MKGINSLLQQLSQIKSLPQRRKEGQKIAKSLDAEGLKELIEKLEKEGSKTAWDLISHLISPALYEKYPAFVISLIEKLAQHEDWEIREEAATVLKRLKEKHFDSLYPTLKCWAEGENPYLKRAICVAMIKPFRAEKENLEKIFYLFEKIISCDHPYVKKNCGPFGLAAIFRRHPKKTQAKLYEWLEKYPNNPTAIWNIITVFSQANAKYFKKEGRELLQKIRVLNLLSLHPQLLRTFESVQRKLS